MKKKVKYLMAAIFMMSAFVLLQRLLMPKYMNEIEEGALMEEYYAQEKDFDVVFIGDCEVYENFIPQVLWDEYGIHSYIRGSAQQLIWQSYYLAEETLYYEKPDVIVFNVLSMKYNEPQSEAYNRLTLDGMRWSPAKAKSVCASMMKEESFAEYLFPILRYHTRITELGEEDVQYLFHKDAVGHNGYLMQTGVVPVEYIPEGKVLGDYSFGENAYYYLDKLTKLCQKEGVKLVLIKAPSLYPYWYEEWDEQMQNYADENGLLYVNLLDDTEKIGLDYSVDTYDAGLHLNVYGAKKLSSYFGNILQKECSLSDRTDEEKLCAIWDEKRIAFEQELERKTSK